MESKSEYQKEHSSYMSNNMGSTAFDVISVTVPSLFTVMLLTVVHYVMDVKFGRVISTDAYGIIVFFVELTCIVFPLILSLTVYPDHPFHIILATVSFSLVLTYLYVFKGKNTYLKYFKKLNSAQTPLGHRAFITNIRAYTNMVTVFCILAVDFAAFPRRFAKTETYGYSLMDVGVGMCILVNALVAPETRIDTSRVENFGKMIKSTVLLALIGIGRYIITQKVNYNEHVTEYGRDWNFFFTLAGTKLICHFVSKCIKPSSKVYLSVSVIIIVCYETVLNLGLKRWIFSDAPRDNFISANREGLASVLGYVSLYFAGVTLGRQIKQWDQRKGASNIKTMKYLTLIIFILWPTTLLCGNTLGVSRRLANLGYGLWMLLYLIVLLVGLLFTETFALFLSVVMKETRSKVVIVSIPRLSEAVNFSGLLFFMLGNILTGLVNMCLKTFHVSDSVSLSILFSYMLINFGVVYIIFVRKKKKHY